MKFEVFLSYAHLDNEPPMEGSKGWVEVFRECLYRRLQVEFKRRSLPHTCEVWMDVSMNRNWRFEKRIKDALSRSHAFVALLSADYIQSYWCGKEGASFLKSLEANYPGTATGREGIFIADCAGVWNTVQGDNETAELVKELRESIAGTYNFYASARGAYIRICEPRYDDHHHEAAEFIRGLQRLAKEIVDHLCTLPEGEPAIQPRPADSPILVALVPPLRVKNGSTWRDYRGLWKLLADDASVALQPVFGTPVEADLSKIEALSQDKYAELRNAFLSNLPNTGMLVQILSENSNHWDDSMARCWAQAKESMCMGGINWHLHASLLEQSDRRELVQNAVGVKNKEEAIQMLDHERCEQYTSVEDLARTIIQKAAALREAALRRTHGRRWAPVLIETCEADSELAPLAANELRRMRIQFTDRRGYGEEDKLPDISKLTFSSIIYIFRSASREQLLYLADSNAKLTNSQTNPVSRAVIYWSPPHNKGFAHASNWAFDHDIPVTPKESGDADDLRKGVQAFTTWVTNHGSDPA